MIGEVHTSEAVVSKCGRAFWEGFLNQRYGICPHCGEAVDAQDVDAVMLEGVCVVCGEWWSLWLYPGPIEEQVRWMEWGLGEPSSQAWESYYRKVGGHTHGCDHSQIKRYGKGYVCGRCGRTFST